MSTQRGANWDRSRRSCPQPWARAGASAPFLRRNGDALSGFFCYGVGRGQKGAKIQKTFCPTQRTLGGPIRVGGPFVPTHTDAITLIPQLCLSALSKLGVSSTADDLQAVAASLHAWDRGRGIVVAAFVDGIIAASQVLGTENEVNSLMMASPTPISEQLPEWEREMEKHYDSFGPPVDPSALANSPRQLSRKESLKVMGLTNTVARKFESDDPNARAKDWRMSDRLRIREADIRNNPAVTKTWQTIQMPTGVCMHMEQLGHYDPMPPRRLSTPRLDPYAVGHLTNSELLVFRSLKKSMAADQPFSKMNSFQRLATPMTPRHKPLASALRTRTVNRNAHLVPELAVPHMDTGHRLHESGSQTERAMRATKPNYVPTVPLISQGGFRPHPSWASCAPNRYSTTSACLRLLPLSSCLYLGHAAPPPRHGCHVSYLYVVSDLMLISCLPYLDTSSKKRGLRGRVTFRMRLPFGESSILS